MTVSSKNKKGNMRANSLTPGMTIDALANHIASYKSKLGTIEKHKMGSALTGRRRIALERMEAVEALATSLGYEVRRRVDDRVAELLKDD